MTAIETAACCRPSLWFLAVLVAPTAWAGPALSLNEDAHLEIDAARQRLGVVLDTSGAQISGDVGAQRALRVLQELQSRKPGLTFSQTNQPGAPSADRLSATQAGSASPVPWGAPQRQADGRSGGLFGTGLNADAQRLERVKEAQAPAPRIDVPAVQQGPSGHLQHGADMGAPRAISSQSPAELALAAHVDNKPGALSKLLRLVRENRVLVIASAAALLLVTLTLSLAGRRRS